MNYFNLGLVKFFVGSTNEFFTHTANYWYCELFFTSGTENYFFIGAENYFSCYRELFFWSTIHCGLAIKGEWFEYLPVRARSLWFHLLTLCCKCLVMDKSVQRQIRQIANNTITEIRLISQLVNSTHTAAASNERSSSTLSPLSAGSAFTPCSALS